MLEATSLKACHHGNTRVGPRGSDEDEEERRSCAIEMNSQTGIGVNLQSSGSCFPERNSQAHDDFNDLSNDWSFIGDLSQDVSFSHDSCAKWVCLHILYSYWYVYILLSICFSLTIRLERRWMLWYEFMKEHSCLDDWLRAAEKVAMSPNSSYVLYAAAKEELQKYEVMNQWLI